MRKKLDVLYVIEQDAACAMYRARIPGLALSSLGYKTGITLDPHDPAIHQSRVVVWQRPSIIESLFEIIKARKDGIITVVDVDDDLWNIAKDNPAYESWNKKNGLPLRCLNECFAAANIATTTTPKLASKIMGNYHVKIIPNMLHDGMWRNYRHADYPDGKVIIGWAGSVTHRRDLLELSGVVETILVKYPEVEFQFGGMIPPFDTHERLLSLKPVPMGEYPEMLQAFDIGIAPVQDTQFNRAKSDLKYIEYAACGIPTIASANGTYENIKQGVTGYKCKNAKEWIRYLSKLIENKQLRQDMGDAAYLYAQTRNAGANAKLWVDAYGLPEKKVGGIL